MERVLITVVIASLIFTTEGIQDKNFNFVKNFRDDAQKTNKSIVSHYHMRPSVAKLFNQDEEALDHEFNSRFLLKYVREVPQFFKKIGDFVKNIAIFGSRETTLIAETAVLTRPMRPTLPPVSNFFKDIEIIEGSNPQFNQQVSSRIKASLFPPNKNVVVDPITVEVKTQFRSTDFIPREGELILAENLRQPIFVAISEQLAADSVILEQHYYEFKPEAVKEYGLQKIIDASLKTYQKEPKINKVYIAVGSGTGVLATTGVLYISH